MNDDYGCRTLRMYLMPISTLSTFSLYYEMAEIVNFALNLQQ